VLDLPDLGGADHVLTGGDLWPGPLKGRSFPPKKKPDPAPTGLLLFLLNLHAAIGAVRGSGAQRTNIARSKTPAAGRGS
jgi:hypothetical protein